jgi:TonB family protein
LGPGIRHYEIQNLKVGKWIQRDASVEFGIEDVDVTELPARTHPIETYQGSIASFRMAGEEKSTTWGSWRWTAEMIRGPNERGDGPAILLLADQPTFPSDSDYKSGEATVRMKVSPSGDVSEVRVVKATHKEFGNNAKEAAMQWKFVPRVKGGVAVEGIVEMTFVFHKTSSS